MVNERPTFTTVRKHIYPGNANRITIHRDNTNPSFSPKTYGHSVLEKN